MATINLDRFRQKPAQTTIDNQEPRVVEEDSYIYKDIDLDFALGNLYGSSPADKNNNITDLTDLKDIQDIKQSIRNIFNTTPGQKLLNPRFGLNLIRYVFDPMTQPTADLIARTISIGLPTQEPRIEITYLDVTGVRELNQYIIKLSISVQDSRINDKQFSGVLSPDGFKFER